MPDERPRVTIYTDGGADPNPGPGGWAVILIHEETGRIKELSGGEVHTTNNRMELTAAIEALSALRQPCQVRLVTDSEYLQKGITRWVRQWVKDDWKRGRGKRQDVENADLWQRLLALTAAHRIKWDWVRGHTGDQHNERADRLATQAIRAIYAGSAPGEDDAAEIYLIVSAREDQGMWAASVRHEGGEQLLTGQTSGMTSNQLDILAAAEALSSLPDGIRVRVYALSDYLRNGAAHWLAAWKRRGWQTKAGEPVKNRELWERLDAELSRRRVEWPDIKEDPSYEFAFEDLGRRAQEGFEEQARRDGLPDWDDTLD